MNHKHNEATPVNTVRGVQFGILSEAEIIAMSACEVTSPETHRPDGTPEPGGLFDLRMGPIEPGQYCATCHNNSTDCEGHFGFIRLASPVANNGYWRELTMTLGCVCHSCSRILLPEADLQTTRVAKDLALGHFKAVTKKAKTCPHCQAPRLNLVQQKKDDKVTLRYTEVDPVTRRQRELSMAGARQILSKITTADMQLLGFNPENARPESMIITHLLIPPPIMRPSTTDSRDQKVEDDIFWTLRQIVRISKNLEKQIRTNQVPEGGLEHLALNVNSLFDNSQKNGGAIKFKISNKERRGIRQTLEKKGGRVYQNLMGKRQDFSARSVGGGDIANDIDEVLCPLYIAENWKIVETVNQYNIDRLQAMALRGREYPAIAYLQQGGEYINIQNMKPADLKNIVLREGDRVERQVIDGDWVIFNRMPSLHRPSMLGAKVRIDRGQERRLGMKAHRRVLGEDVQSGQAVSQIAVQGEEEEIRVAKVMSIKVNPCCCAPLNLDFDGDELNLILSRTIDVIVELSHLMSAQEHMISSKNGMALIALMQDGLLGAYTMSTEDVILNQHLAFNLLGINPRYDHQNRPLEPAGVAQKDIYAGASPHSPVMVPRGQPYWTSRQIFSTILPPINFDDGKLVIVNGMITKGTIGKEHMAKDKGTLLLAIHHDFGSRFAAEFLSVLMRMCVYLITHTGATVSLSDYDVSRDTTQEIADIIEGVKTRCSSLLYQMRTGTFTSGLGQNPLEEYEMLVGNYMSNTVALTANAVNRDIRPDNNFLTIAEKAGSKGNAGQYRLIVSHIGQQNVGSNRIEQVYHGRTMPSFHHGTNTPESRGFVGESYLGGVGPLGYVWHQMNSRNSLIDKVVEVSTSGYLAKKLGKCLEDILVTYDMTVRTVAGRVIQSLHGEDGCNVAKCERVTFETFGLSNEAIRDRYPDADDAKQIISDRDTLRSMYLKTGIRIQSLTLPLPFNARRVLLNARKDSKEGFVSLKRAREMLETFMRELPGLYHRRTMPEITDDIYKHAVGLTAIQMRAIFAPCLVSRQLSEEELAAALDTCRRKFMRSLLHPGEMIGALTAQCLAEENTQLMLNAVHSLGAKAKSGMVGGVARLNEIIRITKKPQSPVMYIYLKERFRGDKHMVRQFASQIEHTTIESLAEYAELVFDRQPFSDQSDIVEDRGFIRDTREKLLGFQVPPNATKWVVRVILSRSRLLARRVRIMRILEVLHGSSKFFAVASDDNADQIVLRVSLLNGKPDAMQPETARALKDELMGFTVYGIAGISDVAVRDQKLIVPDPETGALREETEYFMDTTGSNITEIMSMPFVDQRRTRTNDINEVYTTMGSEPCRRLIYLELQALFGEAVDPRVILVLTDFMTCRGRPTQINSSGLKVSTDSALTRITFEKNYERLVNSSLRGHLDPMTSTSGNVMFGQIIRGGTGYFNLTYDERAGGISASELERLV
jgi:DNA-directed RNA polymerase II subunit RPB1